MTVSCPRCGSDNSSALRYCEVCGNKLPKQETPTNPEGARVPITTDRPPPAAATVAAAAMATGPAMKPPPTPALAPRPLRPAAQQLAAAALAPASIGGPSRSPALGTAQPAPNALPQPRVHCPRCGASVVTGAAFCQSCGNKLSLPASTDAAAPPKANLVVIAQDGTPGREYPITGGRVDIGREQGDVRLTGDQYACPRHARVCWKDGAFMVRDLGSVNGVYARITAPEVLQHGDMILIGLEVFRFEVVNAHEAARAAAYERGTRLFGSPALPRYARLVQRTVEGVASNVFYLSKSQATIGRETGDFVFTDDAFMSRQHATFSRQQDGSFLLTDLGSSNGTFIAVREERPLPDGGHVRIGQHLFRLRVEQ